MARQDRAGAATLSSYACWGPPAAAPPPPTRTRTRPPSLPPRRTLHHQRHRPVVDELDGHHRPEYTSRRTQPRAEPLVQPLRELGRRGLHERRAVPAPGVAVARELAHAQHLALPQRLV